MLKRLRRKKMGQNVLNTTYDNAMCNKFVLNLICRKIDRSHSVIEEGRQYMFFFIQ